MNFVVMAKKIPGNFPVVVTGNNREDLAVQGSSCFIKMWKQEMTLFLRSSLLPLYCISRNK